MNLLEDININKENILLLSEARHGTTFFINNIRQTYTECDEITACYEVMSLSKEVISQCISCLYACSNGKYALIDTKFEEDEPVICQTTMKDLQKIRLYSERLYLDLLMNKINRRKTESKFLCKIFASHILNRDARQPNSLEDILNYFDKVIILDRDNLEYIFSHANALYFPCCDTPWGIESVKHKKCDIILKDKHIINYRDNIKNKNTVFEEARKHCARKNKPVLDIHYNNLTTCWEKDISSFIGMPFKKNAEFVKGNYDYKFFLKNNPKIKSII